MNQQVAELARYWSSSEVFDAATRGEIASLLQQQDEKELLERFGRALEFGTGGLRGIMGAGTNRMNRYTVQQATEGLARYYKKKAATEIIRGVVIGYDSRHQSQEFAKAAAEVLAGHGFKVYIFAKISPTPLVSYAVLTKQALAGIMITASHNPKEYNGYKVYGSNGGQVIPPDDIGIIEEVQKVKDFSEIPVKSFEQGVSQGLIQWINDEIDEDYFRALQPITMGKVANNAKLGVIYTPLHGTGGRLVEPLLRRNGFQIFHPVQAQILPDGNFSTLRSPNPEDSAALEMAVKMATAEDDVILANDPDADRLGVMVKHQGQWERLNGNQIGVLLLDFILSQLKSSGKLSNSGYFIVSNVTSPMAAKIAQGFGLKVVETLTGFKWIWSEAIRVEQSGLGQFVFGMEESHGYLMGRHSGDKDGIWAALAFAQMAAFYKNQGKTALDRLQELYQQWGTYLEDQANFSFPGMDGLQKMKNLMDQLRQNPPQKLAAFEVLEVVDLQEQVRWRPGQDQKSRGPNLPKSNVLIFELSEEARVIVRPSGTEPKIKIYFNLRGKDVESLRKQLVEMQSAFHFE